MFVPRLSACLLLFLLGLGLHAETFTNPRRLPTPGDPTSLLVGDLNHDGRQDILYGSGPYGAVVLHPLLAQPSGAYLPGQDIPLPPNIRQRCLLADLNADGNLDLICAGTAADYRSAYLAVLLGNGDATFQPAQITTVANADGSFATPAVAGDLNHDGHPDIVLTGVNGYQIVPLLGDGSGHLTAAPALSFGAVAVGAQLADLNGDGNPDLLVAGSVGSSIVVFLGHGDGTFADANRDQSNAYAVLADLDGDGHLDLVEGGVGVLHILHGNPDGTFSPTPLATLDFTDGVNSKSGFGTLLSVLACLDLNGDGIPDLLLGGDDGLTVLLGKPGLAFAPPTHYAVAQSFFLGPFMASNALVDLDGDGHLDFLSVGTNGIYILYGKPDGSFVSAPAYESGAITGNGTSADFNGDGTPDVVTTGDSNLHLRLGHGDGTFAPAVTIPGLPEPTTNGRDEVNPQLFHGDFNGDGKQDLLVAAVSSFDSTRTSYLRFGHGDGTFAAPALLAPLVQNSAFAYVAAVADMNHDGRDDILAIDLNDLYVSLSNGDGTFRRFATPIPSGNIRITIADFNHDGILDVAYVNGPTLFLLVGRGDGTFAVPVTVASTPSFAGTYAEADAITSADFDGDGNPDIAILVNGVSSPGTVLACVPFVLFGDGHGSFSAPAAGPSLNTSHSGLYTADLDGDGRADLLASGPLFANDDYTLTTIHSLPGRSFGPSTDLAATSGFPYIALTDLNRDGHPDILAVNGDSNAAANAFTVLLNQPGPPAATGTLTASPEPSAVTQPFSLTATLAPPPGSATNAPLSGTVAFSIDGTPLATAPLVNNIATVPGPTTLSPGTHQLSAVTSALSDAVTTYAPATLTATHVVTGLPTSLSLSASPNPAGVAQQVTFSFAASNAPSAPAGAPEPTGSITLTEGATTLSVGTTSGTSGLSFNAGHSFSAVGTHTITATYSGDALHAPATISIIVAINQIATTTTVALSLNPSVYGQPVTLTAHVTPAPGSTLMPTGTVLFTFCRGAVEHAVLDSTGTATVGNPVPGAIAEPVGACSVIATYTGDTNLLPSTSAVLRYTITPAASATALTAKPNPAYQGQTVTVDAFVTGVPAPTADPVTGLPLAPATLVPTGTIQILEGTTVLASAPVVGGHALIPLNTLAVGTHSLSASYQGDPNLLNSQSPTLTETILPSAFTIALSTPSVTVQGGTTAAISVIATSVGAWAGPLTLSVDNLPPTMLAAFTPAPLRLTAAASAQASLTITTKAVPYTVVATTTHSPISGPGRRLPQAPVVLALLVTAPWLFRRRRSLPTLLATLLAVTALGASLGCANLIEQVVFPPPATYTLPVTATDPATGASQTTTLTLTVTR